MIDMGEGYFFDTELQRIIKNNNIILNLKGLKGSILETLLVSGKEKYLSKEELIESVWGKSSLIVGISSLTQQIYLLRKALSNAGLHNYILSRTNIGYKISKKMISFKKKKGIHFISASNRDNHTYL